MAYEAKVIADSITDLDQRLTTFEVTFPRFVLAEFNTHRMFSRNSASSRAIPTVKQLKKVLNDPFIPIYWGRNEGGMQASKPLTEEEAVLAEKEWLNSRDYAVLGAVALIGGVDKIDPKGEDPEGAELLKSRILEIRERVGWKGQDVPATVHKQTANRILEPFMWHTVIVTATEWDNFYALRDNSQAQPEIHRAASMMRSVQNDSIPELLYTNEWHLPLIREEDRELPLDMLKKISVGRCTRVSYLTHNGTRDINEDIGLHDRILSNGHMSPFEHVATPIDSVTQDRHGVFDGNFRGWHQYRKDIDGEYDFSLLSIPE